MKFFLLFFLVFSCTNLKNDNKDINSSIKNTINSKVNNEMKPIINNKIIPLEEMSSNNEIEKLTFVEEKLTNEVELKNTLLTFKNEIKTINLEKISKWAKKEITNYILPDDFFNRTFIKKIANDKENLVILYQSEQLPSHSPLVKRFLYLYAFYNSKREIDKIYVTIQGYVEE